MEHIFIDYNGKTRNAEREIESMLNEILYLRKHILKENEECIIELIKMAAKDGIPIIEEV